MKIGSARMMSETKCVSRGSLYRQAHQYGTGHGARQRDAHASWPGVARDLDREALIVAGWLS
jgi:hypothetical protein